ncbi:hypothetical protein MMC24_003333 [Lignoscripta atroalba]|nr:hypothetical protein [Lignoscripta atroalba]
MPFPLNPEFEKATKYAKALDKSVEPPRALELYALYKQGLQQPPFEQAPASHGWTDRGYMYTAWKKLNADGVTPEEAQKKYVDLYKQLKSKHGLNQEKLAELGLKKEED